MSKRVGPIPKGWIWSWPKNAYISSNGYIITREWLEDHVGSNWWTLTEDELAPVGAQTADPSIPAR